MEYNIYSDITIRPS